MDERGRFRREIEERGAYQTYNELADRWMIKRSERRCRLAL